jgi:ubiquitin carboxyl-terminal hydrolase 22/27/51
MHAHLQEKKHQFALDLEHGTLYCVGCRDYVYDLQFEEILNEERMAIQDQFSSADPSRVPYQPWSPSAKDAELLKTKSKLQGHLGKSRSVYLLV